MDPGGRAPGQAGKRSPTEIYGEQTAKEMLRRGKSNAPKRDVTIPLDEDVLCEFQALGPGWEGKINDVLREWLEVARGR